ncbi:MAG TPA: UvrB/UvrC motif-containing protein [Candidatus Paceibacterota bacterium]|nr:UvrB/UvrC motif-containing protein [Candidatus Paceibacterota bacterium]
MKGEGGGILYVGKAANLRRRVSSYFERPHDVRIERLVELIRSVDYRPTDSALEALILEAELIKKYEPPFNVREKDDKSFLYIEITKEKFPRVLLVRGTPNADAVKRGLGRGRRFGPFTSAHSAREALRILRRIFPWNTHDPETIGTFRRPCFDYEVGLCPGTCIGAVSQREYARTIGRLRLFLEGRKKSVIRSFEDDMKAASRRLDFEKAEKLRRQLFSLRHIRDTAFISDSPIVAGPAMSKDGRGRGAPGEDRAEPYRIEGYDISNISGTDAVGSMVVFEDGEPNKNEYRKFRIRSIFQPNDVGMLTEVLERRFSRHAPSTRPKDWLRKGIADDSAGERARVGRDGTVEPDAWRLPDLILIDGGVAQANAAKKVILRAGLRIPILGIAKGAERKRNDVIGAIPKGVTKETLVRVRDEAHRFAIGYHKRLRGRRSLSS